MNNVLAILAAGIILWVSVAIQTLVISPMFEIFSPYHIVELIIWSTLTTYIMFSLHDNLKHRK